MAPGIKVIMLSLRDCWKISAVVYPIIYGDVTEEYITVALSLK